MFGLAGQSYASSETKGLSKSNQYRKLIKRRYKVVVCEKTNITHIVRQLEQSKVVSQKTG
jgi:hypothetical protein